MAEVIKKATREAYGDALTELGKAHDDIIVLEADLSTATKSCIFKKEFPERFFNCGIAESNMMSIAAGLATSGKVPFASTFAMFAAGRAFEQVRNSIGYPHLNVKIGASHAGLSVGEDGASHQCNEDIALMSTIPGMTIISPCDYYEAVAAIKAAYEYKGPCYLRLCRMAIETINNSDNYTFQMGKGITLNDGDDVTIIATGLMVHEALKAAEILSEKGINARVINIHTIKPLDNEIVLKAAKETKGIVVAEEHSIFGGLGSMVASLLSENFPTKVLKVGVQDKFGKSGKPKELFELYGLTAENIVKKAESIIK